jgi:MSHA biogenesis protein MshI
MKIFGRRSGRDGGWLAISLQPDALAFAHAESRGGKWRVTRCGSSVAAADASELERAAKQLELHRYRCLTVLPHADYQIVLVDAPGVPAAEVKAAVRWRVKDMLDYRVEDATVEVLDIPPESPGRPHSVYAIAARNETIRACVERFDQARIPLSVIDIAETAQRNVAALFELPQRALAFLHVGAAHALLTINYRAELYLARRIDVTMAQLADDAGEEAKGRLLLELQRSLDHFDRQHPSVGVARLLLGPQPQETGVAAYLAANMDLPVAAANLAEVLEFGEGCASDPEALWRLFPVIGAALRTNGEAGRSAS